MLKTYKALLRDDRLEWLEEAPASSTSTLPANVYVTVTDETPVDTGSKSSAKMVAALEQLAAMGGLSDIIPDPVAWQREIREDRELPGRD